MKKQNDTAPLGADGLEYGTATAEEMIRHRMRRLAERGGPADRRTAINQLAEEGNLKTLAEVSGGRGASLAESNPREQSAEDRRERSRLAAAKREAAERGISLSEVMNEKANRGEVRL